MGKLSERIAKKIDEYIVHGGTPSAEELIHIIKPLVAQLEAIVEEARNICSKRKHHPALYKLRRLLIALEAGGDDG